MQSCTSRTCKSCSKKHHTLLHINEKSSASVGSTTSSNNASTDISKVNSTVHVNESPASTSVSMKAISGNCSSKVVLSTVVVYIRDSFGKFQRAHALLDNGSQASFIIKDTCERLGLTIEATKHTISCLNVTETKTVEMTKTAIASTMTSYGTSIYLLIRSRNLFLPNRLTLNS